MIIESDAQIEKLISTLNNESIALENICNISEYIKVKENTIQLIDKLSQKNQHDISKKASCFYAIAAGRDNNGDYAQALNSYKKAHELIEQVDLKDEYTDNLKKMYKQSYNFYLELKENDNYHRNLGNKHHELGHKNYHEKQYELSDNLFKLAVENKNPYLLEIADNYHQLGGKWRLVAASLP